LRKSKVWGSGVVVSIRWLLSWCRWLCSRRVRSSAPDFEELLRREVGWATGGSDDGISVVGKTLVTVAYSVVAVIGFEDEGNGLAKVCVRREEEELVDLCASITSCSATCDRD
jgi:hypothetical protein